MTKKNNTFSNLLLDHCYAFGLLTVAFWSEEVFWRKGPLLTYFCPTLDLPLDRSGQNECQRHARGHEFFILTK